MNSIEKNGFEKNMTHRRELPGRRGLLIIAGFTGLLVLLLVLIPHAMGWLASDWLRKHGADTVELQDVDFNPFTGVVAIDQLHVVKQDSETLAIPRLVLDLDWEPLLSRKVYVRKATIEGVRLSIDETPDGDLQIAGIGLAGDAGSGEEAGEPWGYGIDELTIRDTVIDYRTPDLQLKTEVHDLALSGLTTWATTPAPLTFNGALNGAGIRMNGQLPALADGFGFAGDISLSGLSLQDYAGIAQTAVSDLSGRLSLDSQVDISYRPDSPLQVKQEGGIQLDGLQFAQDGNRLQYAGLEWQGTVTIAGGEALAVNLNGKLSGDELGLAMPDQSLGLNQLVWEGEAGIDAAGDVAVETGGRLALGGIELAMPDQSLGLKKLDWEGKVNVSAADDVAVNTSGSLTGSGIDFAMPSERFRLLQDAVNWEGSVGYAGGESGDLKVSGRLDLGGMEIDALEEATRLLGFDAISIDRIDVQGLDAITVENLQIDGALLADSAPEGDGKQAKRVPPLQIASLNLDRIEVTGGKRVSIDTIESRGAQYTALRNKGGKWRMATILESLPFMADDKEGEDPDGGDAEPGTVRVGMLKNNDLVLRFEDYSVSPPFRMQLSGMEVTKNIDTARPDQDTHIHLIGKTARHDSIEIKGTVRPLASPVSLNLESNIEGLELPPLSPYAIASIGHRLDSGQLDAESTLKVDKGQLDGVNKMVLKGLSISPVESDAQKQMNAQLAVPLDKGLDMLRDDHDVIRLKLPITGAMDSPDFDISDVINQAVAKATKEGAIASLTLLLQPYGSLITVARYAADQASAVRLDPVEFAAASDVLDEARHEYLDKVAGIILKRPGINIMLCGVATAYDRVELARQETASRSEGRDKKQDKAALPPVEVPEEQLIDLADRRDAAVKDYLVDKHGVKPGRLVACQPRIDPDGGATPRVDLLI